MNKANERIVEFLFENIDKTNLMPWQIPYAEGGLPHNYITGREYTGRNLLVLMSIGFNQSGFMTFNQATEAGGKVKKGSSGIPILYTIPGEIIVPASEGNPAIRTKGGMRLYYVFNISCVENLPDSTKVHGDNISAEEFIKNIPVKFEYGKEAMYSLTHDLIKIPNAGDFKNMGDYYATIFHKLIHWTGEESRLNRLQTANYKDKRYSYEELVAEIGSSFLRCHFDIENQVTDEQNVAYVKGWLSTIGDDKEIILKAASDAQKAVDFLMTFSKTNE